MIYTKKPKDFNPVFDVVSCFIQYEKEILLVHRAKEEAEGNTWGTIAGKIDPGETPIESIEREIQEETGIDIPIKLLQFDSTIFVRYPYKDFLYYIFFTKVDGKPIIKLRPDEHDKYIWITPQESLSLNLIADMPEVIRMFFHL